jgi:hypothetical protein
MPSPPARERVAKLVREHGQKFVLAPAGLGQLIHELFALGDVLEQDGDPPLLGYADAKGDGIRM